MQNSKLYVGNLSYSVTGEQLKELCSQYGEIKEAVVIQDNYSGRSKGFGFVEFNNAEDAKKAIEALNGTEHEGRALKVNEAKPRVSRDDRSDSRRDY